MGVRRPSEAARPPEDNTMTRLERPVTRATVAPYSITVTGAYPDGDGRRIVVTLEHDTIYLREQGRCYTVDVGIAALYGLLVKKDQEAKARAKRGRRMNTR